MTTDSTVFLQSPTFWSYIVGTAAEGDEELLTSATGDAAEKYYVPSAVSPEEDDYRIISTRVVPDGTAPCSGSGAVWPGMQAAAAAAGAGAGAGSSSSLWSKAVTSDSGLTRYFPEPHISNSWTLISGAACEDFKPQLHVTPVINLKSSLHRTPALTRNTRGAACQRCTSLQAAAVRTHVTCCCSIR